MPLTMYALLFIGVGFAKVYTNQNETFGIFYELFHA
jgi:hypothetical protein